MARTRLPIPAGPPEPEAPPPDELDTLGNPEPESHPSGIRKMRIKWGSEHIQPIQYNGFHIGDLEIEIDVAPNETPEECYARGWAWLERMVAKQYDLKLQGFLGRVTRAAAFVKRPADLRKP